MREASIAKDCAQSMWARDSASQAAGLQLVDVTPGRAVVSMTVEARHTNGHGICHGGYIFMLADTAFAFACNSHNEAAVAQQNAITYTAPASLDDRLTAVATEQSRLFAVTRGHWVNR